MSEQTRWHRRVLDRTWWEKRVLDGYDRHRDEAAFDIPMTTEVPADLEGLRGHKYAVLVTYRRDGAPVPSPMWFGVHGGKAYLRTGAESWKVKRIRHTPHVVIAPSDRRGRPIGPGIPATARILPPAEHPRAIAARIAAYGLGRWIYDRTVAKVYSEAAYLELTVRHPGAGT